MAEVQARILGIDQGTTGTRAMLMDVHGAATGQAYRPHAQHHPQDGWVEHDPAEIWTALCDVCRIAPAGLAGVGLANQGETVLLWRKDTGQPLGRALVWQDTRAAPLMAELAADAAVAGRVGELTGLRLDPYFSAGKLRWLLDHTPGARELAAAGLLAGGTLDAWLLWKLTGRAATDVSTAARTLLFDIHKLAWDDWLLGRFGVPRAILPPVCASAGDFGVVTAPELPALRGVPVLASVVDQPAAMLGHGCLRAGDLIATYGTGCFLYMNTGTLSRPNAAGLLSTIAWQAEGRTVHALEGGVLSAGSLVSWLRDGLGLIAHESELDAVAGSVPDSGGVVCVPALVGLGAPHWRRHDRAAWLGMGLGTTRAHLVRAALEGIAMQVRQIAHAMEINSGQGVRRLRVGGGLTRSAVLMQLQADILQKPVEVAAEPETSALGVCYLAARAAGLWASDDEILRRVAIARRFQPQMSPDEVGQLGMRHSLALDAVKAFAAPASYLREA